MTKKTDKYIHLALSLSLFTTININAQTIWTCSEETDQSPTICLNQEGRELILDINDQDFSLKILGSDFIMNFDIPEAIGNIKGKDGTYISTLIDKEDGTRAIIEMDEKTNFIGKETEYFSRICWQGWNAAKNRSSCKGTIPAHPRS